MLAIDLMSIRDSLSLNDCGVRFSYRAKYDSAGSKLIFTVIESVFEDGQAGLGKRISSEPIYVGTPDEVMAYMRWVYKTFKK